MPSIRAVGCALFLLAASLRAQNAALTPDHMVYPAGMDTTCRPCTDFFRFANGKWLASTEVPSTATSVGLIPMLRSRNATAERSHEQTERQRDQVPAAAVQAEAAALSSVRSTSMAANGNGNAIAFALAAAADTRMR